MKINIERAKTYLGIPYVWGGESIAEGGMDCSGLAYNVFNDSGITVGRDTAKGYYTQFIKYEVSKKTIYSGDLLFFGKSKASISHIAIAISSTEMIESIGGKRNTITNKGKGVSISKISRRKDLVAVCRFENVSRETLKCAKPTLRQGNRGTEVTNLQLNLNKVINAGLATDGIFGAKTKSALKDFQKQHKLACDGIYGRHSYSVMKSLIGGV